MVGEAHTWQVHVWKAEDNLVELVLFFHPYGSLRIELGSLGLFCRHLSLLSHLPKPSTYLLNIILYLFPMMVFSIPINEFYLFQ